MKSQQTRLVHQVLSESYSSGPACKEIIHRPDQYDIQEELAVRHAHCRLHDGMSGHDFDIYQNSWQQRYSSYKFNHGRISCVIFLMLSMIQCRNGVNLLRCFVN